MSKIEQLINDSKQLEEYILSLQEKYKTHHELQNRLEVVEWEMFCIENEMKKLGGYVDGE
jgi:superfamily I DNA and/or RNA helicase